MATVKKTKKASVQESHLPKALPCMDEGEDGVDRRDFIHVAAVSFAGVGAAAVALPDAGHAERDRGCRRAFFD